MTDFLPLFSRPRRRLRSGHLILPPQRSPAAISHWPICRPPLLRSLQSDAGQYCTAVCTVLYCSAVLYGNVLQCWTVLYSTAVLHCTVLQCCTVLYCHWPASASQKPAVRCRPVLECCSGSDWPASSSWYCCSHGATLYYSSLQYCSSLQHYCSAVVL